MNSARHFQSSLRDEEFPGTLNRGLKATATITKSLCDYGTARGKSKPCQVKSRLKEAQNLNA